MDSKEIIYNLSKVKYFFIDFDGTLIKNNNLNINSYRGALRKFGRYYVLTDREWNNQCLGHSDAELSQHFIYKLDIDVSPEKFMEIVLETRRELYEKENFVLCPLIKDLISAYSEKYFFINSNNSVDIIKCELEKQDILDSFVWIYSNNDSGKSKEEAVRQYILRNNLVGKEDLICCIDDEPLKIKNFSDLGVRIVLVNSGEIDQSVIDNDTLIYDWS